MSDRPPAGDPPATPRRGKRVMWAVGVVVLLTLGWALWAMADRARPVPSPSLSRERAGIGGGTR